MNNNFSIVWFRNDLRLQDNPALEAAIKTGNPILSLYIYDEPRPLGKSSKWWLHYALSDLQAQLKNASAHLIIKKGPTLETLLSIFEKTNVSHLFFNTSYEPKTLKRDQTIIKKLKSLGIQVSQSSGNHLYDPSVIKNKQGDPYKVFTPFYKGISNLPTARSLNQTSLSKLIPAKTKTPSLKIADLKLITDSNFDKQLIKHWKPTTQKAKELLGLFKKELINDYHENRDIPSIHGTSRLSPYLHFGQISPYQILHSIKDSIGIGAETFRKELIWREFAVNLLHHFPHTETEPMYSHFKHFPWEKNTKLINAWKNAETGYPIVDAGMRELQQTGWMHNRVRMITASFLIKHLLQHWHAGENHFWELLVDADLPSNIMNWQWSAGCGADAAPFFRIFNPIIQGKKFDPEGTYIKKFIPELTSCPTKNIHTPWLEKSPPSNYSPPIVDHNQARNRALLAYDKFNFFIKKKNLK